MPPRFRALQHRNFQLFIAGQLTSLIGTWMQTTAQLWLVYKLTNSAALLGVFGFANQVPILFLAALGGYIGDRYNRHHGVIWTQTVSMVLAFLLAALTFANIIQVWELIFTAFLSGVVNAFDVPIRQAFLVEMVSIEDLPNAIALNSSIFNGARVVGPAIAGFALAWKGPAWCFFFNGVSFLAVIAALFAMRLVKKVSKKEAGSPFQSLLQGFRFAMSDLPIRSTLLLLSMLSLLGLQYSVFLPIFASDVLHRGAKGFGLLMSAAGVGAVLGALHFAARTSYKGLARWIGATSTVCAVGSGPFFAVAIILALDGDAADRWILRHGADGGDEYDFAEPRAGSVARAHHGRLRDHVHGCAADRVADCGGNCHADRRAVYARGVWNALFFGEHDFYFPGGDSVAAAAGGVGRCLGRIGSVEPCGFGGV